MAIQSEISKPISSFMGLNERMPLNSSLVQTTSLDNVIVRNGRVEGRAGIAAWDGITTDAATTIIGLADFYAPATATAKFLRMRTLGLDVWNSATHAWDNVTGTALNGTTSTRPVFHTMSDEGFMVFTNEGHDRPRKYTGSGNSAVLGGTPPYAKWLCPYVGFLFLFNTSTDGSFSAVADSITAYFSDIPDGSWDLCANNTIIFDESPGELLAAEVIGQNMIVFKADAVIQLRFTQGSLRFSKQKLQFGLGLLAPMSLKKIGEMGAIFLATDRNLYFTDGNSFKPLPLNVQKSLQEDMTAAKAPFVSAAVDANRETYHLLYQRGSSNFFDGRLSYNYRTGEFTRAQYKLYEFTRIHAFRQSNVLNTQVVVANATDVYEMDTGTDDNGTAVTRYYDIDWNDYGVPGEKHFKGADLVFEAAANTQVRVSVARDQKSQFQYAKMYTLKPNLATDTITRVEYSVPSPIQGTRFKLRIEFFHYGSSYRAKLQEIAPVLISLSTSPKADSHQNYAGRV